MAERAMTAPATTARDGQVPEGEAQRSGEGAPKVTQGIATAVKGLGAGQPLGAGERQFFEERFGHEFSRVRVHADRKAAEVAHALSAEAFTLKNDVAFAEGRYQSGSEAGRRLLAHELVHVIQQGQAAPLPDAHATSAQGEKAPTRDAVEHSSIQTKLSRQPIQIQRKLALSGNAADVARVIAVMNQGLGPEYAAGLNAAGEVKITSTGAMGPPTPENQFFTGRLQSIVSESGTTTVSVVSGGVPIVGSYSLSQIDIADIERLGIGERGWDARAALLHELVEQRERQLGTTPAQRAYGSATTGAHGQGLAAELGMIGATLETDSGLVGATTNPDGTMNGTRTVIFKYPDGTRYSVEVTLSHNNITDVKRTKLP